MDRVVNGTVENEIDRVLRRHNTRLMQLNLRNAEAEDGQMESEGRVSFLSGRLLHTSSEVMESWQSFEFGKSQIHRGV